MHHSLLGACGYSRGGGGVDELHSLWGAAESFVLPNFVSPSEKLISSSPTHEITDSQQLGQCQWEENNTG